MRPPTFTHFFDGRPVPVVVMCRTADGGQKRVEDLSRDELVAAVHQAVAERDAWRGLFMGDSEMQTLFRRAGVA